MSSASSRLDRLWPTPMYQLAIKLRRALPMPLSQDPLLKQAPHQVTLARQVYPVVLLRLRRSVQVKSVAVPRPSLPFRLRLPIMRLRSHPPQAPIQHQLHLMLPRSPRLLHPLHRSSPKSSPPPPLHQPLLLLQLLHRSKLRHSMFPHSTPRLHSANWASSHSPAL
jgi:hypothetical protein